MKIFDLGKSDQFEYILFLGSDTVTISNNLRFKLANGLQSISQGFLINKENESNCYLKAKKQRSMPVQDTCCCIINWQRMSRNNPICTGLTSFLAGFIILELQYHVQSLV